jgi:proteasome activator subunit 4
LAHLTEEAVHTDAYALDISGVEDALRNLELEFPPSAASQELLQLASRKATERMAKRNLVHEETVSF